MTYRFKLSRRMALSRSHGVLAVLVVLAACSTDSQENSDPGQPLGDSPAGDVVVGPKKVIAEIGQTVQLTARRSSLPYRGRDAQAVTVDWSASGGTITSDGLFSASQTGTFNVVGKGRGRNKSDSSVVIIVPSQPTLLSISISPDTARLVTQATRTFLAKGTLSDGTVTDIGVTWVATGGSIDAGGVYLAGSTAGRFKAVATSVSGGKADTAAIVIDSAASSAPNLQGLRLTPTSATLTGGQVQQFVAEGQMSDGTTKAVPTLFTASGGTVDSTGSFTAGAAAGTFRLIASAGGFADTSLITVVAAQTGTTIYPGQSIQAAVNAFPGGTAFLIKAGVHRLQQVAPKDGDKFTGETGAILDGAALLTSFAREGGYWTASGQTAEGEVRLAASCQAGFSGCAYPEQLFMDDVILQHVSSLSSVGPGKWYFDYAGDKIYFSDDPTGRKVELSVAPYAFYSAASNVTIEGLVVEKYASPAQRGAIGFSGPGSGWIVRGNEVRWNHGAGIRPGNGIQILNNNVHHQGQMGIAGSGNNVLLQGNEIAYNNMAGFGPGQQGEAGGTKLTFSSGLVVRGNFSHHNHGPGLWTDINNINTLYEGNRVEDNDWRGIFHEISYQAVIRNNIVRRNGFHNPSGAVGAVDGAGILISNSPNVEVYGNTVEDNRSGITGLETDRASSQPSSYGPHNLTGLYVHDNTVKQTDSGRAAGIADTDPNADAYSSAANNRWVHNVYVTGTGTKWRWAPNADVSPSQWLGLGQDSGSTFK